MLDKSTRFLDGFVHLPVANNDGAALHQDKFDTTLTLAQSSPLTVSELTSAIKIQLESNFLEVTVQGEISNCKLHSSGHLYFDLKDHEAKIPAVFFKAKSTGLLQPPKEGDQVIVKGSLSVYPPHGRYQLIVKNLTFSGVGALLMKFELLKQKLKDEGLFNPLHKKKLPVFPKTIGVITSPTGAVIKDIIHVLRRRCPGFHLILHPTLVQGEGAAEQIAEAIGTFNQHKLADILIVGRGGGSLEDLWAFNEEVVARAIFKSDIPIVSAVGHETDITLADFVADVRAPTPSAAAEIVSFQTIEQLKQLNEMRKQLDNRIQNFLIAHHRQLQALQKHPLFSSPLNLLNIPLQRLDQISNRLNLLIKMYLDSRKQKLKQYSESLKALNPKNVLQRGYAIVFDEKTNAVIASSKNTAPGDCVNVTFVDGQVQMTVNP